MRKRDKDSIRKWKKAFLFMIARYCEFEDYNSSESR